MPESPTRSAPDRLRDREPAPHDRPAGGTPSGAVAPTPLLQPHEPHPFAAENLAGASGLLFVCEHGGKRFPERLGPLGLAPEHQEAHFVWDIGALELARSLSRAFDAPLLHQRYSRLLCDPNRRPDVPSYIPAEGEGVPVPGNRDLSDAERAQRTEEIWRPFHRAVAAELDRRCAQGRTRALVTVHSFTPRFHGVARPWEMGVLYDRDPALSPALYDAMARRLGDRAGRNEPYAVGPETDYTIPVHGEQRGLPCVEIEVRNDQLRDAAGVARWSETLAAGLREACAAVGIEIGQPAGSRQQQGKRA